MSNKDLSFLTTIKKYYQNILREHDRDIMQQQAQLHKIVNKLNTSHFLKHPNHELEDDQLECKCCNETSGQPISLLTNTSQFGQFGIGIQLVFSFMKIMLIISLFGIAITLPNLVYNYKKKEDFIINIAKNTVCLSNQFYKNAYINIFARVDELHVSALSIFISNWIFVIYVLIIFGVFQYQRYKLNILCRKLDAELLSPSDYAVKIQNFPLDLLIKFNNVPIQAQIKDFLIQMIHQKFEFEELNFTLNVNNIQIVYDTSLFQSYRNRIKQIVLLLGKSINQNINNIQEYQQLKNEFITIKNEIHYEQQIFKNGKRVNDSGHCCILIIFETQNQKTMFLKAFYHKLDFMEKMWKCLVRVNQNQDSLIYNKLKIYRPQEPEDIRWGNCNTEKKCVRWILIITTFFLIIGSTALLIYLTDIQTIMQYESQDENDCITAYNLISFLVKYFSQHKMISNSIMLTITFTNILIREILFYFAKKQGYHSKTKEISASISKILLAQCLNTLLVPLIVDLFLLKNIAISETTIFQIAFYNILIENIIVIINPFQVLKSICIIIKPIRRWCKFKQYIGTKYMNQKELNRFYQGPQFDIQNIYIYVVRTMLFTGFYMWKQPIVLLLAFIGIGFRYWIQKISLLRRYNKPPTVSQSLSFVAFNDLEYYFLAYGVGLIIFFVANHVTQVKQFQFWNNIFPATLGILLFIISKLKLRKLIYKYNHFVIDESKYIKYSDIEKFPHNKKYEEMNPSTQLLLFDLDEYLQKQCTDFSAKLKKKQISSFYNEFRCKLPWSL